MSLSLPRSPLPMCDGNRGALLSDDGVYRYRLWRRWSDGPACCFVMLNPSTADATEDDPTIRRCIGFAKREGCGKLIVVNLFALRSTDPRALFHHPDPFGPENAEHIEWALSRSSVRIAAWGAFVNRIRKARPDVPDPWLGRRRIDCLGFTAGGAPRHPLYVAADTPLHVWAVYR